MGEEEKAKKEAAPGVGAESYVISIRVKANRAGRRVLLHSPFSADRRNARNFFGKFMGDSNLS